ncbi:substrate-binding domain-containing protein [Streptomyces tricolor]|nr:substrate-binding domain-containing protein [Streptomyces tricolor]
MVGFDDLPEARWVAPALTTVRQPLAEMAATALQAAGADDARRAPRGHPGRSCRPGWCSGRARPRLRRPAPFPHGR